ncbi:MAG: HAD family hydrolase [Thermoleophilaceae bacterium]
MTLPAGAFFDLDKTLIEGSSGIYFARAAYRAGMIGRRQLGADLLANVRFRVKGSTDAASEEIRRRILDAIAGTPVRRLQRLGPEILAGVLPRVYPEVLRVAYEHQDAGRPAFIVTAVSQEMAELMAHVLVLDGGIGTRSEIRDGIYTGRPDGPFTYRAGKAEAVRLVAAERGIDLSASYAYSDSESDLPLLRAVGHPVAVNPDAALERVARAEGWQVMRFDKLGRRLRIAAALGAVTLAGGAGGYLAGRVRGRPGRGLTAPGGGRARRYRRPGGAMGRR